MYLLIYNFTNSVTWLCYKADVIDPLALILFLLHVFGDISNALDFDWQPRWPIGRLHKLSACYVQ